MQTRNASLSVLFLVSIAISTSAIAHDPDVNRELGQQCIAAIRALAPKQTPSARWTGTCGWDSVSQLEADEYAEGTKEIRARSDSMPSGSEPVILSGAACNSVSSASKFSKVTGCGRYSGPLSQTLAGAEILVPLPGNRCIRYVPLMLTDKTADFSCTALRARPACAVVEVSGDKTIITLATTPQREAITERFEITRAMVDRWQQHNTYSEGAGRMYRDNFATGQLYLIRAGTPVRMPKTDERERPSSLIARIRVESEAEFRSCMSRRRADRGPEWCRTQQRFHAERLMQEAARVDLNVKDRISSADHIAGVEHHIARMSARKGSLTRDQWTLYNVIAYNEIGLFPESTTLPIHSVYASPYALLDAIYGSSGLSWGTKQIDLYGNEGNDIARFWKYVSDRSIDAEAGTLRSLRACFTNPLKTVPVFAIASMHNNVSTWSRALQSDAIARQHDEDFIDYLRKDTEKAERLSQTIPMLKSSRLARMFYLDQLNQRDLGCGGIVKEKCKDPNAVRVGARHIAKLAADTQIESSPSVSNLCRAEKSLLDRYDQLLKQAGDSPYPERRVKMVRVINKLDGRENEPACRIGS